MINKTIFILTLLLSFHVNTFSQVAQSDTTLEFSEVIIEENRFQIPFSEISRNITLISKEQIQQSPVQSIPEILSYVGGVDIKNRGMFGTSADISIRGSTFEQTLILLNGTKMNDPQTGHHNLSLPLDFMNISQIEVLKGAAARTYGQNALAGVVNIRTEIAEQKKAYLRLYGGDYTTYGLGFGQSLPHEKYAQQFYVARDASQGFRYNTQFTTYSMFYQSALKTQSGDINLIASHSQRNFGANGFYGGSEEQYEEVGTSLVSVDADLQSGNWKFTPRLYWRRGEDQYFWNRPQRIGRNLHVTNTLGAEFHANLETSFGNTGIGLENRNEYITSNNLGIRERSNLGIFAEQLLNITDDFNVTAGVYFNYFTDFGWQAFPGIDLGYQVSDKIRLYASIGRAYRIPSYIDLYFSGGNTLGNADLVPEESLSYEGGIKFLGKGFLAEASYYLREEDNLIDFLITDVSTGFGEARNINNINTGGVEVNFNFNFQQLINSNFWVNRFNISYNYIEASSSLPENTLTRYTLENFTHQLIMTLNHKIWKNISHQLNVRYLDRVTMPDYWLLDSRIAWHKDGKSIFIEASNITNTQYQELLTPMPERWFKAGVNWNFGL